MRLPLKSLLLLVSLVAAACGAAARGRALREQVPAHVYLVVDVPRREAKGVTERWAFASRAEDAFMVHASDVERRRVRQTCGSVPIEKFVSGWKSLQAQGLLRPVEDYRLVPGPGAAPFAARLQLRYVRKDREIVARRPLESGELDPLLRVLRGWESALQVARPDQIPPELRVDIGQESCGPKPARPRDTPGPDAGKPSPARPPY